MCTNANNFTKFVKNKNKSVFLITEQDSSFSNQITFILHIHGFRFTEIQEKSISQIIHNIPNKKYVVLMEYQANYSNLLNQK